MKILVGNERGGYVFSASAKTITLSNLPSIKLEQVLMITNTTKNKIIYTFSDSLYPISITNNIITVSYNTALMDDTDTLQIFLDLPAQAYDPVDDMLKVKSMQKKFRDSFGGSVIDTAKWDVVIGSGMTAGVASGTLSITTGVTASALTTLISKEHFTVPFKLSFNLGLSQRIANQNFFIEAISIDPITKEPNGLHSCGFYFDGTTATQAKYLVQNNAITPLISAATTFPTTVGAVAIYEVEPFCDDIWFHGKTMDAATGRANSYVRHQQIPDPNALYKIRIRVLNGATAPASTTTATMQFITCQDYAELTAEITAGRGQSAAGQGVGVYVTGGNLGTQNVSGTITANQGAPSNPTASNVISLATTNAGFAKASAGTVYGVSLMNYSASPRYLKLFNKASAPTVGTDLPVTTIMVPATSTLHIPFGTYGRRFSTGIAYALTGGLPELDTTVTVAGDCRFNIDYI